MKLDAPRNPNYAATVVRITNIVELPGLDNLVGVPVFGHQALTTRDVKVGDLRIAFTAETQLSEAYCYENQLYRDKTLNRGYNPHSWEGESGYLERNRRIRALKLRGHVSNALLMPIDSVSWVTERPSLLKEGDTFDTLDGNEICRKYEIQRNVQGPAKKIAKVFKRVDTKIFPEHLDTDNFWRNKHILKDHQECIITQKLHGTSIRVGRVPVSRNKGRFERLVNRLPGITTPDWEFDVVYGSRKVIKDANNPNQNHYYQSDLWTEYGSSIADLVPEGYILYGELVGWTKSGQPIQKNYTYHLSQGEAELYVYRVAHVNRQGVLTDLSWNGVKDFCTARGLKWTPELFRHTNVADLERDIDNMMDQRYADSVGLADQALKLSNAKTVDEGVVIRQDGLVPVLLKAKSPKFLEHETKMLDEEVVDLESAGVE